MTERFRHGSGRLCLDFVRTLRYRGTPGEIEELPDTAAIIDWVNEFGPCQADSATTADVRDAHRLREAVYALITAGAADRTVRERVNDAAALPVPVPGLDSHGSLRWTARRPVTATLASIARDAVDLVTSPAIDRVRGCANPDCGALFLDSSRPGQRRWCSMGVCGNQAKKHALRARS